MRHILTPEEQARGRNKANQKTRRGKLRTINGIALWLAADAAKDDLKAEIKLAKIEATYVSLYRGRWSDGA